MSSHYIKIAILIGVVIRGCASNSKRFAPFRCRDCWLRGERVEQGLEMLGTAMSASHASSSTKFGNSCPELDAMCEAARGLRSQLVGCLKNEPPPIES